MEGIAFSDSDPPDLLPRDLSEYDQYHWLIATQAGWSPREGTPCESWEALEALLDRAIRDAPDLRKRGWSLVDAGMLSTVVPYLQLDEWTCLIGFRPLTGPLDAAVADPAFLTPLGAGFFESLARHQATAICYIDGWWECFPATSPLLINAGPNLQRVPTHSEKWLRFEKDPVTPVYPDFNDEP